MRTIPLEQPLADLLEQREVLETELRGLRERAKEDEDVAASAAELQARVDALTEEYEQLRRDIFASLTPLDKVQLARHPERPYTLDYLSLLLSDFSELHGDRRHGDDAAIVAGLGLFAGTRPVGVVGHQKGRDLAERKLRNFGQAGPAGYRKGVRVMELAARFGRPVLTFIDTSGADARPEAEEQGISEALAASQLAMAMLPVPIVATFIGEGASGGAIALAVADHIVMLEHSYYSVITPEGCASIIWRDAARHAEAADALRLSAQDALEFGFCDEIIAEPLGGAHHDPGAVAARLSEAITNALGELDPLEPEALIERRYAKFRCMGLYLDEAAAEPVADDE